MSEPHRYRIRPIDPNAHLYEVTLRIAAPDGDGQIVEMPAWIPGSYMIRDYARHVVAARAESGGREVALDKIDKSRWQAAAVDQALTLTFEIYAHDDSVRGAHLDTTHAYFNGVCVFPMVRGQEDRACLVDIEAPAGTLGKDWRVATAMQRDGAEPYGFGRYRAADYDELIDHPVEIGQLAIGEFEAGGIPHAIAIRGRTRVDMARLCHDLQAVCEQHMALLPPPADLDRYVFLLHAPAKVMGGWSTAGPRASSVPGTSCRSAATRPSATATGPSWGSRVTNTSTCGTSNGSNPPRSRPTSWTVRPIRSSYGYSRASRRITTISRSCALG